MAELYILASDELPPQYQGAHRDFRIGPLGTAERVEFEDFLFQSGERIKFSAPSFAIWMPGSGTTVQSNRSIILVAEFAFALLTVRGHPKFSYAAVMDGGKCKDFQQLPSNLSTFATAKFSSNFKRDGLSQWLYRCLLAHKKNVSHIDVVAHRYVRYSRFLEPADALFDLCVALESLLNAQTEVSFRFGVSLVKLLGLKGSDAQAAADLFGRLYALRSKLAHGAPDTQKLLSKMQPDLEKIRNAARNILVA